MVFAFRGRGRVFGCRCYSIVAVVRNGGVLIGVVVNLYAKIVTGCLIVINLYEVVLRFVKSLFEDCEMFDSLFAMLWETDGLLCLKINVGNE